MEQERRALLVDWWLRLKKIDVPVEQWPTYRHSCGRTLLEMACSDSKFNIVVALFEAGCRIRDQATFLILFDRSNEVHSRQIDIGKVISRLLFEKALKEQISFSSGTLNYLLKITISNFFDLEWSMRIIDLGGDCWNLEHPDYNAFPSLEELVPYRRMVHRVRRRRCRAVIIALLGACGRWRKAQKGALRDVAHAIGCAVWQARKQALWN